METIITVLSFLASAVAIFFAIKKQSHDENNVDADTISSLFQTVKDLECENRQIKKDFEEYKRTTNEQLADLASEVVRYRKWAKRLVSQLESAGIVPARFE
jgi:hypothetical protein